MEPTSEQELKQLLEEGKITEEDYHQLLEAIHQKDKPQLSAEESIQSKSRTDYRKVAPLIFIVCGVLPFITALMIRPLFSKMGIRLNMLQILTFLPLGALCVLLAIKCILWLRRKPLNKE